MSNIQWADNIDAVRNGDRNWSSLTRIEREDVLTNIKFPLIGKAYLSLNKEAMPTSIIGAVEDAMAELTGLIEMGRYTWNRNAHNVTIRSAIERDYNALIREWFIDYEVSASNYGDYEEFVTRYPYSYGEPV
jgi:hypothetical protein